MSRGFPMMHLQMNAFYLVVAAVSAFLCLGQGCPMPRVPDNTERLTLQRVVDGLVRPVDLQALPDDQLLVVDQVGVIWIVDARGRLRETPFLDIRDRMVDLSGLYDERGLLSLALHPDFGNNGRLFVVYNAPLTADYDAQNDSLWRLSEFQVYRNDRDRVDSDSEIILIEVAKPQPNHNGGQVAFGPQGYLYVSLGDGGGANDAGFGHNPDIGNGQDLTTALGKILRYDASVPGQLIVPVDNPYINDPNALGGIYAVGFRNPWRFSFDEDSGRLFVSDAGQALNEEINLVQSGGNYGWPIREGTQCFNQDDPTVPLTSCNDFGPGGDLLTDPILEYGHGNEIGDPARRAVVGGHVYRGSVPSLTGLYLFGDWSSNSAIPDGSIFLAEEQLDETWTYREVAIVGQGNGRLNRYVNGFGQDNAGESYLLTSGNSGLYGNTGEVLKIVGVSGL